MKYFVEIVSYKTGETVKRIECNGERQADKVDGGANINLNHDEYYTRIVTEQDEAAQPNACPECGDQHAPIIDVAEDKVCRVCGVLR